MLISYYPTLFTEKVTGSSGNGRISSSGATSAREATSLTGGRTSRRAGDISRRHQDRSGGDKRPPDPGADRGPRGRQVPNVPKEPTFFIGGGNGVAL